MEFNTGRLEVAGWTIWNLQELYLSWGSWVDIPVTVRLALEKGPARPQGLSISNSRFSAVFQWGYMKPAAFFDGCE